jgi:nucleotide-binding universal stress UspA family protein
VVGTHGRRGIGRVLLGSGAEQIIRTAPVPVLVIRSPEGASDEPA